MLKQKLTEEKGPVDHKRYPTDCGLHHGVQAALRGVQVPRDALLVHLPVELPLVGGHAEDVPVAEGRLAVLLRLGAGVQQLLLVGVGERQHRLIHESTEPCGVQQEGKGLGLDVQHTRAKRVGETIKLRLFRPILT